MRKINSYDPSLNFKLLDSILPTTKAQIKEKVQAAHNAKVMWKEIGIRNRVHWVKKIFEMCKAHEDEMATIISREIGTGITECKDEIAWDWDYFEWFINNAEQILTPKTTFEDDKSISQLSYDPIGVAAVITPWNLPFDLFMWGVIPNLLVGNTVVYKASEECVLTGKLIEELMQSVKLPLGVFSSIHGDEKEGSFLVHQDVDLVWFTGSSAVGNKISEVTGKKKIKAILEMGGSNPAVISSSADVEPALNTIMFKRFIFSGQTCDAIKRLIVHEDIFDSVVLQLKTKIESIIVGNSLSKDTQMGPVVSKSQLELLESQLGDALSKGAVITARAPLRDELKGAFFAPILLTKIKKTMRVWKEEVFGPILPIIQYKTFDEAIELANDSPYGLTAQIYSTDKSEIDKFASRVKAGSIDVNGAGHFKPSNPFGGCKNSGIGREHGELGFLELCEPKLISNIK